MTTIVYKDGILAFDSKLTADTLVCGTGVKGRSTKDYMAAAAGAMEDIQAFLDWIEAGYKESDKSKFGLHERDVEIEGILITKKGEILCFDGRLYPYPVHAPFYALGSGAQLAMGAMAMGANAYKAIKIAAMYDTATGGDIKVLAVKKRKLTPKITKKETKK